MTTNHTRTARERAEELAYAEAGKNKDPHLVGDYRTGMIQGCIAGFLARDAEPATVTAEQIEAAARVYDRAYQDGVINAPSNRSGVSRDHVKKIKDDAFAAAFRAAGFRIEGDEA